MSRMDAYASGYKKRSMSSSDWILVAMMGVVVIFVAVMGILVCVEDNREDDRSDTAGIGDNPRYIVDEQSDAAFNTVQKTVYDNESGYTYIYTYDWSSQQLNVVCTRTHVVIVDNNGEIIYTSDKNMEE